MMRRLIILDYFFTPDKGHDRDYDYAVADEAVRQGVPVELWVPLRGQANLPAYVRERLKYEVKKDRNIFRQVWDGVVRGRELRGLLRTGALGPDCTVLIQKIDYSFMVTFWVAALGLRVQPRFVVILRRGLRDHYLGHRLAGALLISLINYPFMKYLYARKRFCFWSDSEMVTEELKAEGMSRARTVPIPHLPDRPTAAPQGPRHLIGYLGGLRLEKGAALLPALVEGLIVRRPAAVFLLHVYLHQGETEELEAVRRRLLALAARYPRNLEIIDRYLPEKEYKAQLARCAVVLIPYQASLYAKRTSGVLAEAIAGGAWAVVPGGTWMAKQAERYGRIVAFDQFAPAAVLAAVEQCLAAGEGREAGAVERQIDGWYRFHSPRKYLELLKEE